MRLDLWLKAVHGRSSKPGGGSLNLPAHVVELPFGRHPEPIISGPERFGDRDAGPSALALAALFVSPARRLRFGAGTRRFGKAFFHRMVLVTAHRRENLGPGLIQICHAVATLAARFPDCRFVFPVHPNPQVQTPVRRSLSGIRNVYLIEPVSYQEFVWLLDRSTLVLTDSGGIQEEAPTLSKPVVIMRDTTERLEAVELGTAILAGAHCDRIVDAAARFLRNQAVDTAGQPGVNPFGDGQAAERIVQLVLQEPWAG